MSVTKLRIFKYGSIHECSGIFRHRNPSTFGKGNTAVYDRSSKLSARRLQQWVANPLFSKLNEITSVLQMSVTNQQGSIKKNFPLKLKIKAVCIRSSNLAILNTVTSQVCIAVCKCLFRNPSAVIF